MMWRASSAGGAIVISPARSAAQCREIRGKRASPGGTIDPSPAGPTLRSTLSCLSDSPRVSTSQPSSFTRKCWGATQTLGGRRFYRLRKARAVIPPALTKEGSEVPRGFAFPAVCAGAGRSEGSAVRRRAAFSFIEMDDPCIPWARLALWCRKSLCRSRACSSERPDGRDPTCSVAWYFA
jgi:hypothetical protein